MELTALHLRELKATTSEALVNNARKTDGRGARSPETAHP
jgi:hypothetical protein